MKKTTLFTIIISVVLFVITSCSKSDKKVEPIVKQDIDYISITDALCWYHTNTNMVYQIRFVVLNESPKTLCYLKFRANIYRTEQEILMCSDVFEAGSKTDIHKWNVESGDTQNTDYFPVDFIHADNWYYKVELLEAKFIE